MFSNFFVCPGSLPGPTSDLYDFLEDLKNFEGSSALSAKRALLHLTWMCDNYDALKDELRRAKGLKTVTGLWQTCNNPELKAVAVLCLASAINNNVESQEELYHKEVFDLLLKTLTFSSTSPKIKHVNVCLIMSLASQNGIEWLNQVDGGSRDLWFSVVTAICAIIYYPQNEENQLLAVQVLPKALGFLNGSTDLEIVRRLTLFITYVITNNATIKRKAFGVRGFKSLISSLTSVINSDIAQRSDLAVCHVRVINTFIDDNEEGVQLCAECNIVSLLVNLLGEFHLEQSDKLQVVIALSHCVTNNKVNQENLAGCDGVAVLARLIAVTNDQELSSVIKYILQICLDLGVQKKKENEDSCLTWRFGPKSRFMSTMESFLDKLKLITKTSSGASEVKERTATVVCPVQSSVKNYLATNSASHQVISAAFSHSTSASADSGSVSKDSGCPQVSKPAKTCHQKATTNTESEKTVSVEAKATTLAMKHCLPNTSHTKPCDTAAASLGTCTVRENRIDNSNAVRSSVVPGSSSVRVMKSGLLTSSERVRSCSQNQNDASLFKKPFHVPEKVKSSDESSFHLARPKSVKRKVNSPTSVQQSPSLNHRAPVSCSNKSVYHVPSPAPSVISKFDRDQFLHARKTRIELPPTKFEGRHSTSQFNCVRPPQTAVTGTIEKVKSWLNSTTGHFTLNDNATNNQMEEQHLDEDSRSKIELAKKCLGEALANDTRCKSIDNSRCPGCQIPAVIPDRPILNSLTYNIAVETNSYTCQHHRAVRQAERLLAAKARKAMGTSRRLLRDRLVVDNIATATDCRPTSPSRSEQDVYEFEQQTMTQTGFVFQKKRISPPSDSSGKDDENRSQFYGSCMSRSSSFVRRQRIAYSEQEIANLKHGVATHGKFWTDILNTYEFHPRRTAVDLKDKYRQLLKTDRQKYSSTSPVSVTRPKSNMRPFSMAEERRLKRGVRMFGYNWKAILSSMRFAEDRTAEQLRNKWRTLHGN